MPVTGARVESSLAASRAISDEIQPVGEGWSRHNQELLVHPPSQVFFAQRGNFRGKYLVRDEDTKEKFRVCPAPHVGRECPIELRAAAASVVRPELVEKEAKMERAVVIAEMPKTARLALKFSLGFLDTPAACYGLFSGIRGVGAAQWCASQFHQRLLPRVSEKIHGWWDSEAEMPEELLYRGSHVGSMSMLLKELLEQLDKDLLASAHGLAGCDAVVAVLIGESLVTASAGQASVVLLPDDCEPIPLLQSQEADTAAALGQLDPGHVSEQGSVLLSGDGQTVCRAKSAWDLEEPDGEADPVGRLLRAPDAFAALGIPEGGPSSPNDARVAYKKLALRVHPDKVRGCKAEDAKAAFARLEQSASSVEAMAKHSVDACQGIHRILRCDPFTMKGARAALQLDEDADDRQAQNAMRKAEEGIGKAQVKDAELECRRALEVCKTAAETLRNASQHGAAGQAAEKLLAEPVRRRSLRSLGLRDLRGVGGAVEVETAAWRVGEPMSVCLAAGTTAELVPEELEATRKIFQWQPKAAARAWCSRALELEDRAGDSSASAICLCVREHEEAASHEVEGPPAAKRARGQRGPRSVRLRHLLLRAAEAGKVPPDDPMARRKRLPPGSLAPKFRTPVEAELELVGYLRELLSSYSEEAAREEAFRKLIQQHSECQSADSGGKMCGDLGWVSRGQFEPALEQAAFSLRPAELSDVVVTSRGLHIIQRIA